MKYGRPTVKCLSLAALCLFSVSTFLARKIAAQNITQVTKCQSIYGSATFVTGVTTSEREMLLGDRTKGLNGVLVSDAVLVSDDTPFNHAKRFINSTAQVSDGVLVSGGVLVNDGVVLTDVVVLVSDENPLADSVAQAMSAQTNGDPSRILFLQIEPGVDCRNY
jgi:hypothetical protein